MSYTECIHEFLKNLVDCAVGDRGFRREVLRSFAHFIVIRKSFPKCRELGHLGEVCSVTMEPYISEGREHGIKFYELGIVFSILGRDIPKSKSYVIYARKEKHKEKHQKHISSFGSHIDIDELARYVPEVRERLEAMCKYCNKPLKLLFLTQLYP